MVSKVTSPAAGGCGPGPSGVSDASAAPVAGPAAGASETGKGPRLPNYRYVKEWRRTRMGAITYPIAVCLECKDVIEPVRTRFSRVGTHGEYIFIHEHPIYFIELLESNTGRRSVKHDPAVAALAEAARGAWETGAGEYMVKNLIRALLASGGESGG